MLSHRFAEVDLAMKARALSECSNPDELRGHWRKEPGFMAFGRYREVPTGSVALLKAGEIMLRPWTVRLARRWLPRDSMTPLGPEDANMRLDAQLRLWPE